MSWTVTARDVGCDCCSYVVRGTFDSRAEAEAWVADRNDSENYDTDGDDQIGANID